MRRIKAGAAPEVAAVGIEPAAIEAPAGAWRRLGLGARSGDLENMPVGMAVERDEQELVGLRDLPERVTPAEGDLEFRALRMPAGSAADRHGPGRIPSGDAAGLPTEPPKGVAKELQVGEAAR
jgi:hypothetical protein